MSTANFAASTHRYAMTQFDIQQVIDGLAQCIEMQKRWATACVYLHGEGDDEAAYEAMMQSDMWRDRGDAIERLVTRPELERGNQ